MADGEPPEPNAEPYPDDSGVREQAPPIEPPTPPLQSAPVWPPAPPTPLSTKTAKARKKIDWQAHWATWQTRLGNGLTHLGRWLTQFGRWLARVGKWLARLSEVRPSPLQTLAILGGFAVLGIFGALAFSGNAFGQACVIAFVPGLCIAVGILGNRWYSRQELDQHLASATQNAIYATQHLKSSVRYVDDRLSEAQAHLENGRQDSGLIEVVRAKTATELSLGTAEQASRQWGSVSASRAQAVFSERDNQIRPRITAGKSPRTGDSTYGDVSGELIAGSVARVEDQYTLIINRGSEHGATLDMVFAVLSDGGDEIVDPETGKVIGELPTEKLRVKVVEVQSKYARAATFRTFTPTRFEYPALTGYARSASADEFPEMVGVGAFDSIDESISKILETELAETLPVREQIANAKSAPQKKPPRQPEVSINVGDRVRQVR